jgi:HPt (histidine-containing phosphotransfer) domain-containing protein
MYSEQEVQSLFLDEAAAYVEEIEQGILATARDFAPVLRAAHSLKGGGV